MNRIEKIEQVELKVRQLALKMERLQEENAVLAKANKQLKNDLVNESDKKVLLEQKLGQLSQNLHAKQAQDPKDIQEIRQEIDHYIQEIDKCIEWLYKV